MPLLVDACGPALGALFVDVIAEGAPFRIRDFDAIDEAKGLDGLGLDQPPDIGREGGDLAHEVVEVEIGVVGEKLRSMMLEQFARIAASAAAPDDQSTFGFRSSQATNALGTSSRWLRAISV